MAATLVLMPGMDGTGELFAPLLGVLPGAVPVRVVSYPTDRALAYEELLPCVVGQVPPGPVVLVAESFSGPLAVRYAAGHPQQVQAVALVASFVRPPGASWLRALAWPRGFSLPMPPSVVRGLLVGWDATPGLVEAVKAAVARVRPEVMALRLREVLAVDCAHALRRCAAPVLYVRARRDRLVWGRCLAAARAARPGLVDASVDGPHLLLQARPQEAWQAIAAFLSSDLSAAQDPAADCV